MAWRTSSRLLGFKAKPNVVDSKSIVMLSPAHSLQNIHDTCDGVFSVVTGKFIQKFGPEQANPI